MITLKLFNRQRTTGNQSKSVKIVLLKDEAPKTGYPILKGQS